MGVIAPRQCRPSHRALPSDKSIAAPNRWFGLQSIAVLHIGATPRTEFLFAFGEKPDATRTSDARTVSICPLIAVLVPLLASSTALVGAKRAH